MAAIRCPLDFPLLVWATLFLTTAGQIDFLGRSPASKRSQVGKALSARDATLGTPPMNDAVLREIADFGRRAVNDGKLANRLRSGGRITTDTLDRIRAFMAANGDAPPAAERPAERPLAPSFVRTAAPALAPRPSDPQRNFRFFDNRQKYLLFVNTCSEKWVVAHRVSLELANIHPRPPAVRVFDAGVGDGTVLA